MADGNDGRKREGSGRGSGMLGQLAKVESFIQLALAIPAGCLIGWLLGTAGDKHFHTGWMVIAGILLGATGGFIQIFVLASRYMKRGD